jgi:hypothetical protein
MELSEWERVLRVNLTGTFLCARAVARTMKEAGKGVAKVSFQQIDSRWRVDLYPLRRPIVPEMKAFAPMRRFDQSDTRAPSKHADFPP